MKKILMLIVVGFILALVLGAFMGFVPNDNAEALDKSCYIRIHIRANSNDDVDQNVKYKVKTAIVDYLTPIIAECETLQEAHEQIGNHLTEITNVANNVLEINGFNYRANARLNDEYFPTRAYADLVLDEGVYDALIVELGQGTGNNWWCVVYPPLCFIGAENEGTNSIVYKSKIVELINKYCK